MFLSQKNYRVTSRLARGTFSLCVTWALAACPQPSSSPSKPDLESGVPPHFERSSAATGVEHELPGANGSWSSSGLPYSSSFPRHGGQSTEFRSMFSVLLPQCTLTEAAEAEAQVAQLSPATWHRWQQAWQVPDDNWLCDAQKAYLSLMMTASTQADQSSDTSEYTGSAVGHETGSHSGANIIRNMGDVAAFARLLQELGGGLLQWQRGEAMRSTMESIHNTQPQSGRRSVPKFLQG